MTVKEEADTAAPAELRPKVNNLLGAFLFSDRDIEKPISVLSGGEKNRLTLLKLMMQPSNLLILDEPTNHLDLHSKDVLLEALKNYTGTVIFVSHDRAFIRDLADSVLDLTENGARFYGGDYDYFLWKKSQTDAQTETRSTAAPEHTLEKTTANNDHKRQKETRNLINRLQKESQRLLSAIETAEERLRQLHAEWSREECYSDPQKSAAAAEAVRQTEDEIAKLTDEWEETENRLASAQAGENAAALETK